MNLNTHDDPSGLFAAIGGLAAAVLSLVAVFAPIPPGLTEAVLGVIATGGAVWTAFAIRRHAYAPATVDTIRNLAARTGDPTPPNGA